MAPRINLVNQGLCGEPSNPFILNEVKDYPLKETPRFARGAQFCGHSGFIHYHSFALAGKISMDPIADMLTIIRNAQAVKKNTVKVSYSAIKFHLANILVKEGFLASVEKNEKRKKVFMILALKYYEDGKPRIMSIKKVSTPGQRIYVKADELKKVKSGYGRAIVSTSSGLMTGQAAKKQGLGGEYLCNIW